MLKTDEGFEMFLLNSFGGKLVAEFVFRVPSMPFHPMKCRLIGFHQCIKSLPKVRVFHLGKAVLHPSENPFLVDGIGYIAAVGVDVFQFQCGAIKRAWKSFPY